MRYQYKLNSVGEAEAIFEYFNQKGFKIDLLRLRGSISAIATEYFKNHPYITIYPSEKSVSGHFLFHKDSKQITLSQVFGLLEEKVIDVVLNGEYTAKVSNKGVEVGCQTFPLEIIEKLMEAKKQLNYEN